MTRDLLSDSYQDIMSIILDQISYGMAVELDNQLLNGTGSPCSGVLTAKAGFSVVMATGLSNFSSISADNLRNMIRKLPKQYRDNGKFVYHGDIQYYIDGLKDTTNRYIYREPAGVRPAAVWNRPIIEASNAPDEGDTAQSKAFAVFGDLKQFFIGRRLGAMAIDIDPYTKFAEDMIRLRGIQRWGLNCAVPNAFCRLVTAS
jgi:HK97 family phage major capsid protein